MGRSVSFDVLTDGRKASEELQRVGRAVAETSAKIDAAGGSIDLDTAEARAKLAEFDRQLGAIHARTVKLDADRTAAERQLKILEVELERATGDRKVKVEAKIEDVQAKLRAIEAEDVELKLQTASAEAKLEAFKRRLAGTKDTRAEVHLSDAGAAAKALAIAAAVASIAPAALAATAALAGIAVVGSVGIGAVIGGFHGIGDAVTALGDAEGQAGQDAASHAQAQTQAAEQIISAKRSVTNANQQLQASEHDVERAQDAIAAASRTLGAAHRGVETAVRSETDAERAAEAATDALSQAREDATRKLEDYETQTRQVKLAQEDAALSVKESQTALEETRKREGVTAAEIERAELRVAQAKERVAETDTRARRLAEDKAAADKKGVDGSKQVVAAQDAVAAAAVHVEQAHQGVVDAGQKVEDAQAAVAEAHYQAEAAQTRERNAATALSDAQRRLAQTQAQTAESAAQASTSQQKLDEAMAKLGPHAQDFARTLHAFTSGPLSELQHAGQEAFLPGVEAGIKGLEPVMKDIEPQFEAFSGMLGDGIGKIIDTAGGLAKPFMDFSVEGLKGLEPLGPALEKFQGKLGNVLEEFAKSGDAEDMMNGLADVLGEVLNLLPDMIEEGRELGKVLGPSLGRLLDAVLDTFHKMGPTVEDLTGVIAGLADGLASILDALSPEDLRLLVEGALGLVAAYKAWTIAQVALNFAMDANPIGLIITAVAALAVGFAYAWEHSEKFRDIVTGAMDKVRGAIGWVKDAGGAAADWISAKWHAFTDWLGTVPGWLGNLGSNMGKFLVNGLISGLNWAVWAFNSTIGSIGFTVPDWIPFVGGRSWVMPQIPYVAYMAEGGIVTGPTRLVAGEREPEMVLPLSKARQYGFGGDRPHLTVVINGFVGDEDAVQRKVTDSVNRALEGGYSSEFYAEAVA